jgi:hypothetical protein
MGRRAREKIEFPQWEIKKPCRLLASVPKDGFEFAQAQTQTSLTRNIHVSAPAFFQSKGTGKSGAARADQQNRPRPAGRLIPPK